MKKGVVWFRNDLRIRDNEALYKASVQNDVLYPVYIFDPRQFALTDLGFTRFGAHRLRFLLESVSELRDALRSLGTDLIIRTGLPEIILPELIEQAGAQSLYCSKESITDEKKVETEIEQILRKQKIRMNLYWQHTLFHEEDVPWPIRQVPEVFTHFRKEAEKTVKVREEFPPPEKLKPFTDLAAGDIPSHNDLGISNETKDSRQVIDFQGGENAAWNRLNYYFWEEDLLRKYKFTRNGLLGGDYSSKLSPWLAAGCISARSIYFEIKRYEENRKKNISTYWLFFELLWRDFFRFMAKKHGKKIFIVSGFTGTTPDYTKNIQLFEHWKKGETGESFVDANMKELLLTGYMSNRGRQNAASFLIHDLGIKWTWGAKWFENRLIDYDASSNWLNWAYIAGVGNDPKSGRRFNIESQALRYDPKGEYVNLWLQQEVSKSL
ncbi:MAG: DASH family cryptochrome [Cyclobacteriaceae bacterium]